MIAIDQDQNILFVQRLGREQLFVDAHAHFQSFDFPPLLPINYVHVILILIIHLHQKIFKT